MAADVERLAEQFAGEYPEVAQLLWAGVAVARKLGAPESFTAQAPDLSEEHRRQGLVLAGRFAERLGLSKEAYIATLPEFPEKPSTYGRLGLTVPVIVETRIPWPEAAQLSGIHVADYMRDRMSAGMVRDWRGINFDVPEVPFAAWFQDGTRFVNKKPSKVRKELGRAGNGAYVAGSILPAISMQNVQLDVIRIMFWDLIGTEVDSDGVPYLSCWGGKTKLDANDVDNALPFCRALVFGREIRTL